MKASIFLLGASLLAGCVLFTVDRCYYVITVPFSAEGDWQPSGVCRQAAEAVALQCGLAKTIEAHTMSVGYVIDFYDRRTETHVMIFPMSGVWMFRKNSAATSTCSNKSRMRFCRSWRELARRVRSWWNPERTGLR